jgi:AcrR family transcriptional regulator
MEAPSKRELRKLSARQEIMNIAENIFATNGYNAATMDMLADASNWSKGALYTHFKSKEELFFTIVVQKYELYGQQMAEALAPVNTLESLIQALVTAEINFFTKHQAFFRILLAEQAILAATTDEDINEHCTSYQDIHNNRVEEKLASFNQNELPLPPQTLALSITGAIHMNLTASMNATPEQIKALSKSLIRLFLHGILDVNIPSEMK